MHFGENRRWVPLKMLARKEETIKNCPTWWVSLGGEDGMEG